MRKALKPGKGDKQMPKIDGVKGTFPTRLSFGGKLSFLFSWILIYISFTLAKITHIWR